MVEMLEPQIKRSAVSAVDDSFLLQQLPMMMGQPVSLDVLSNDTAASERLTITSVQSPIHGSVAIQHDAMFEMYGMSSTPDTLLFTPSCCFTGF